MVILPENSLVYFTFNMTPSKSQDYVSIFQEILMKIIGGILSMFDSKTIHGMFLKVI